MYRETPYSIMELLFGIAILLAALLVELTSGDVSCETLTPAPRS